MSALHEYADWLRDDVDEIFSEVIHIAGMVTGDHRKDAEEAVTNVEQNVLSIIRTILCLRHHGDRKRTPAATAPERAEADA